MLPAQVLEAPVCCNMDDRSSSRLPRVGEGEVWRGEGMEGGRIEGKEMGGIGGSDATGERQFALLPATPLSRTASWSEEHSCRLENRPGAQLHTCRTELRESS